MKKYWARERAQGYLKHEALQYVNLGIMIAFIALSGSAWISNNVASRQCII